MNNTNLLWNAAAAVLVIINGVLNITVRQSRQSGVARATCPD
jgi:hypothetical protein